MNLQINPLFTYKSGDDGLITANSPVRDYPSSRVSEDEIARADGIRSSQPRMAEDRFREIKVNRRGQVVQKRERRVQYFQESLGNRLCLAMIYVPGGQFQMGASESEKGHFEDEGPQHPVAIQPFFLGKYPVTQAQWQFVAALPQVKRYLDPNPSRFKRSRHPVEGVSWYNAIEFCARLSRHTGRNYRLPEEAEWEYACRAGESAPFHYGATLTPKLANYDASSTYAGESKGKCRHATTRAGSFPPNAFGLYDLHGNVWEWCADLWFENYETRIGDPTYRLLRGGSWYNYPGACRSASRLRNVPDYADDNIGFRVACDG
jgi:formylglycine-generating enzyme required for sulfatase activity